MATGPKETAGASEAIGPQKRAPAWNGYPLAPERLNDQCAAQQHQTDDVYCFSHGGSLAGATRRAQFSKPAAFVPRSDRYVNISGTFIATHRRIASQRF